MNSLPSVFGLKPWTIIIYTCKGCFGQILCALITYKVCVCLQGCGDAVSTFVQDNLLYIAAVGIAFVVGEIVVVLMAFCLLCCTDFEKE